MTGGEGKEREGRRRKRKWRWKEEMKGRGGGWEEGAEERKRGKGGEGKGRGRGRLDSIFSATLNSPCHNIVISCILSESMDWVRYNNQLFWNKFLLSPSI